MTDDEEETEPQQDHNENTLENCIRGFLETPDATVDTALGSREEVTSIPAEGPEEVDTEGPRGDYSDTRTLVPSVMAVSLLLACTAVGLCCVMGAYRSPVWP